MLLGPNGFPVPRVLTAALARDLGYGDGQVRTELRRERWQQLVRGVYLTRVDRPVRSDWIAAGLAIGGPAAVISGWDSVRAYGIGSDRPPVDEVLVLAPGGTHRVTGRLRIRPSLRPVESTRLGAADGGFGSAPMAHPARAAADTALVYRTFDPVRALVTSVVQRRLCTPDELEFELAAGPQNGSAHLRRAIEDVFHGVESISEAELADLVRAGGLPIAEYNVPIHSWDGRLVANADAFWRELRAGLEVDSKRHHFYDDRWEKTMKRHNRLTSFTLSMTHYPPAELRNNKQQVVDELDQWLSARAIDIGVRYRPTRPDDPIDNRPQLHVPFVLPRPVGRSTGLNRSI